MSSHSTSSESNHAHSSTECSRRHRQRVAQGQPVRHYTTTTADRMALLNTPYASLDRNQRRRARRYAQELAPSLHPTDTSSVSAVDMSQQPQLQQQAQSAAVCQIPFVIPSSYMHPGINPSMAPSIPPFIPVAMIPSSLLTSFFLPSRPQSQQVMSFPVVPSMIQQQPPLSLVVPPAPTIQQSLRAPIPSSIPNPISPSAIDDMHSDVKSELAPTTSQPQIQQRTITDQPTTTPSTNHLTTTHSMAILAAAATLPSTNTSPSQSTTSTSVSTSTTTPITIDDLMHTSSYLVHSYEQVITETKYDTQPPHTSPARDQPIPTPMSRWRSSHDHIYKHILQPQQRHRHMVDVGDTPGHGRYLSVFDIDMKQDTYPNPNNNIIQEMLTKSTSSSSTTSAQQLKRVLPLSMTTHTHPSYSQQSISSPHPPPTIRLTTLKQGEAYERLVHASSSSTVTSSKHIFTPSININCVKDPAIRQRLIDIARAAQQQYKYHTPRKHQEVECDEVFISPLDGFGISGLQVYIKSGECVTWLHDELLWCAALNYMLKESQGCALWIAVGLHDLKQVMSLNEVEKLLLSDPAKRNIMEVGTLLDSLLKSGTHIEYVFQYPGTLVASPPGNGAAHFVYSYGTLMTQIAWDYSFTIPGAVQCLSYWGIDDNHDHLAIGNTSMSTISVVPLYTMQLQGYELGLMDRIRYYQQSIVKLQSIKPKTRITHNKQQAGIFCPKCLYRQDWIQVNNKCVHCYFKDPKVRKLLQ
jgi:hypothetical protein